MNELNPVGNIDMNPTGFVTYKAQDDFTVRPIVILNVLIL